MEYYAEQSLLIKIIIFVIAWLIIAILGKISVPQIPIPKWAKIFFCDGLRGSLSACHGCFCKLEITCYSASMLLVTYFTTHLVYRMHYLTGFGLCLHLYSWCVWPFQLL